MLFDCFHGEGCVAKYALDSRLDQRFASRITDAVCHEQVFILSFFGLEDLITFVTFVASVFLQVSFFVLAERVRLCEDLAAIAGKNVLQCVDSVNCKWI